MTSKGLKMLTETRAHIADLSPVEFEKWCTEILREYAVERNLQDFVIKHNEKVVASDGNYQIDIYAEFTALEVKFKVLCECKKYKNKVNREKVAVLHRKLDSIGAQKGIMISTGGYQSGAIEYAKEHGIALIIVKDYHFEFLSHSSDPNIVNENDPFLYAERNMPPYEAFDLTADSDEKQKVYPTRDTITKLLVEMDRQIKEMMGIDMNSE